MAGQEAGMQRLHAPACSASDKHMLQQQQHQQHVGGQDQPALSMPCIVISCFMTCDKHEHARWIPVSHVIQHDIILQNRYL